MKLHQSQAASTMISTFNSARASLASPQARAGAWSSGAQAFDTSLSLAKSFMSANQIVARRIFSRNDSALINKTSTRARRS